MILERPEGEIPTDNAVQNPSFEFYSSIHTGLKAIVTTLRVEQKWMTDF